MVCSRHFRVSLPDTLEGAASCRIRALGSREMGFLDCCFRISTTWLVEQPNPDWRLLSRLLTLEIVILSLCAIYFVGGTSWLKHFGFSICFILLSVPWPGTIENFIIQGLTQTAALITVTSLNLFRIWALQHGKLQLHHAGQSG